MRYFSEDRGWTRDAFLIGKGEGEGGQCVCKIECSHLELSAQI